MSDIHSILGTMYFTPAEDKNGKPISKYEGTVVGFIVQTDTGTEFEVRRDRVLQQSGKSLAWGDVANLVIGQPVVWNNNEYAVQYRYPETGEVSIVAPGNNTLSFVVKHHELKRV